MIYEDYEMRISSQENSIYYIEINRIMNQAYKIENYHNAINYLMESKIIDFTNNLWKKVLKEELIYNYFQSFANNIRGLLSTKNQTDDFYIIKYKKTLVSYMNLELISISYDKIKKFFNNDDESILKKKILAISTVELSGEFKINKEIINIYNLSINSNDYLVIPFIGCTVDIFRSLISTYKINILHISGHGSENKLCFVGSNITSKTFDTTISNSKNKKLDWICLNCCYSNSFIKLLKSRNWNCDISYNDLLIDSIAYDFSDILFTYFFQITNGNISLSFSAASSCYDKYVFNC